MSSKKRVLLITQHFYPEIGSAANRLKNIYMELNEKGYDVKVLTLEPRYPSKELYENERFWDTELNEEDVIRIEPLVKKHSNSIFKRLFLYLEVMFRFILEIFRYKKEVDYIFVTSPPIFVGFAGLVAKWKLKAPLILDIRDLWPESIIGAGVFSNPLILSMAFKLEDLLYRKATKIFVNSKSFINYMNGKNVPTEKIYFMPNSLTEDELSIDVNNPNINDKKTVIYTGNLGLAQDIQKLIKVAENLKNESNIQFTIVGYGYHLNELEKLIKEKKLNNINLQTARSRNDTLSLVAKADIAYVSLVDKDVFKTVLPGKIIDYMCVKKPIIGDVAGYASDIIHQSNCGIVSTENSVESLANNILKLASDEELCTRLGENGYQYAYEHLRWKTNIRVLEKALEDIDE
ncbi:glycosyltransferase family 4 protein [Bacillus sp. AFS041924]|uniref:glycosyltransferase family 4 protein n=1 Tax=Bacillus sp. AFS041924 TaxID=2033503 RepID=UPI000BFE529A|nr:glycosyltransferase family 4 protein [Bacillus sp. AFS041924]PGS49868.1 glycosyltransferase WbuB [Bacillus sp. AFS041924]